MSGHLPTPHVSVTLDLYGLPVIEAHNFTDGSCKAAVKPFEDGYRCHEMKSVDKPEAAIAAAGGQVQNQVRQTVTL